ncbi:MAG: hypothetical protein JNN32_06835 [Flavobacteriales bacterium]|nr:hypothetical protein [Flavobacteriales bacterium]
MFESEERFHEVNVPVEQKQRIKDFLQGSVYCWCKNRKHEQFKLQDLLGGDNTDWTGTPLIVLYLRHIDAGHDHDSAMKTAAQDAGWLLKQVLNEDGRKFQSHPGYTRSYEWVS